MIITALIIMGIVCLVITAAISLVYIFFLTTNWGIVLIEHPVIHLILAILMFFITGTAAIYLMLI